MIAVSFDIKPITIINYPGVIEYTYRVDGDEWVYTIDSAYGEHADRLRERGEGVAYNFIKKMAQFVSKNGVEVDDGQG